MDPELIVGMIIMALCSFGCGGLILGLGIHCKRSDKPASFWSHQHVLPEQVTDILSYNHECSVLWKKYSTWYFIAGILSCLAPLHEYWLMAAAALLGLACLPGIPLLIFGYQRIAKRYILR